MMKFSTEVNWVTTKCLVDSNVLIAYLVTIDTLHDQSKTVLNLARNTHKYFNPFIVAETLTVVLQKSKDIALIRNIAPLLASNQLADLHCSPASLKLVATTLKVFTSQPKTYLSFTDCSLIAQARILNIPTILTFDKDLRRTLENLE